MRQRMRSGNRKSNATVTTPIIIYRNWLNGEIVRHINSPDALLYGWMKRQKKQTKNGFLLFICVYRVRACERITPKGVNCQWKIDSNLFFSAYNRTEINKHQKNLWEFVVSIDFAMGK